jgi:hypothetical protein
MTTGTSEKRDKVLAHRAERAAARASIAAELEAPHHKQFGDPWNGAKDGRQFLAKPAPDALRK